MTEPHIEAPAGILALPPDAPERRTALAHATGCPPCAAALEEAARLHAALDGLPPLPRPSAEVLARVASAVRAALRRDERRWLLITRVGGALLAFALVALLGRTRSLHGPNLLAATWALAAALGLGFLPLRPSGLVASAAGVAVVLAQLTGGSGELGLNTGLHCVLIEGLAALLPLGMAGFVWRRQTSPTPEALAASAALGALAGSAGLALSCPHQAHLAHVLVFHALGVAFAGGLGLWVGRRLVPQAGAYTL